MNPITEKDVPQTLRITGSVTSKIITEKDVREFVTAESERICKELKGDRFYLACSSYCRVNEKGRWSASINGGVQFAADSLPDVVEVLVSLASITGKQGRIAALRKEADELEASIVGAKA